MTELKHELSVATLTKVHGVRGELKLRCEPSILVILKKIIRLQQSVKLRMPNTGNECEVFIQAIRGHDQSPIIAIEGISDRTQAEQLCGSLILLSRHQLPKLSSDEYFLADVVGCSVFDAATGSLVGQATRVDSMPANAVVTIALNSGESILVSLVGDSVTNIDTDKRRIDVDTSFLGIEQNDG